jgi:Rrf2 family protein
MSTISQTCSYAFRTLTYLNGPDGEYQCAEDLAGQAGVPGPYLAKLLQELVKGRILEATRGRRGGFKLAKAPEQIHLSSIVDLLDGPGWRSSCILGLGQCEGRSSCAMRECCLDIRRKMSTSLEHLTLKDLSTLRDSPRACEPTD